VKDSQAEATDRLAGSAWVAASGFFCKGGYPLALSEVDRTLLERCLAQEPKSWYAFVDRFMGLVVHVVNHVARSRSVRISAEDRDDYTAEVFLAIVANEFAVLRHFQGQSSLATYLTVVARRVIVRAMERRATVPTEQNLISASELVADAADVTPDVVSVLSDREQVERLLSELEGAEADVVRLFHLDGKSYYEISMAMGMPENSIGPLLSRAREKLRRAGVNPASAGNG
jgi:RNA polymerase sigma-70 factor (ECF subfamily)